MSPPQLAADAPVSDVLQPVEVNAGETFRDDFYVTVGHGGVGFAGNAVGFFVATQIYEPLQTDQRFYHRAATLAVSN